MKGLALTFVLVAAGALAASAAGFAEFAYTDFPALLKASASQGDVVIVAEAKVLPIREREQLNAIAKSLKDLRGTLEPQLDAAYTDEQLTAFGRECAQTGASKGLEELQAKAYELGKAKASTTAEKIMLEALQKDFVRDTFAFAKALGTASLRLEAIRAE
ncbi:MAG: hypothetical protein WC969_01135 [Elusimicrobiota bacterium]|jgi:hypothetical protein